MDIITKDTLNTLLYSGLIGGVLGALISSIITSILNYRYQKKLLNQQISFQRAIFEEQLSFNKKQADFDTAHLKKLHEETVAVFTEFRNMMNTRLGRMTDKNQNLF
jgi:hypothetical protein